MATDMSFIARMVTYLAAVGRERSPLFPVLEHSPPRLWQAWQGWLSSHLIRFKRHHSHARATWLRLGRTVEAVLALPMGEDAEPVRV